MSSLLDIAALPVAALFVTLVAGHYALKGFAAWLDYKKLELASGHPHASRDLDVRPETGGVIEMADLKERVRKLEAIAAGIDL